MGQHADTTQLADWPEYDKNSGTLKQFEGFLARCKAEGEESSDPVEKATLELFIITCRSRYLRQKDKNPQAAFELLNPVRDGGELLEAAAASWESSYYHELGRVLQDLQDPEQAVDMFIKAAEIREEFFSCSINSPYNYRAAARAALKANNPGLASTLAQRALRYSYLHPDAWEGDHPEEDQAEWLEDAAKAIDLQIEAAEQQDLPTEDLRKHKEELVFPTEKSQADNPGLVDLMISLPSRSRAELFNLLRYCKIMVEATPESNEDSIWEGALMATEGMLAEDPAIRIQMFLSAFDTFNEYNSSLASRSLYPAALQATREAQLPGMEHELLERQQTSAENLYGEDSPEVLIARAQFLHSPIKNQGNPDLASGMHKLLRTAGEKYPEDKQLLVQLLGLSPPEALSGLIATEISPEKQAILDKALKELDQLIGLKQAKQQIRALQSFIALQRRRQAAGEKPVNRANHFVFTGPPGTGKTTVARLLGRILYALDQLPSDKLVETSPAGLIAGYVGQTAIKTQEVLEKAAGGVLFIDEAYQLGPQAGQQSSDYDSEAMAEIILAMENNRGALTVVFAGYSAEMSRFLESNPGLASRISEIIDFPSYTGSELSDIFIALAAANGYSLDEQAKKKLPQIAETIRGAERERFGNGRAMRSLFEDALLRQAARLTGQDNPAELSLLRAEDLVDDSQADREAALKEAEEELQQLIGLSQVKDQVRGLADLLAVRRERAAQGLTNQNIGNHLIFEGPPGTGKTTVCRIWAKILYGTGQLPSANLVEATRADLVANYVGQTATKTRQLVRQARGGVLMIDEAYSLADGGSEVNFAAEAMTELIKLMEDERENLSVVLCGYKDGMKHLMEVNAGLSSRISETISFNAYTEEELMQICQTMLKSADYRLSDDAQDKARELCGKIAGQAKDKGGNARDVRKMVDAAIVAQASRINRSGISGADLETIEPEDLSFEPDHRSAPIGFAS